MVDDDRQIGKGAGERGELRELRCVNPCVEGKREAAADGRAPDGSRGLSSISSVVG